MNRTHFSLEIFGDRLPLNDIYGGSSNRRQLEYMKKSLKKAIDSELTERQKTVVTEYYFKGRTLTEIGKTHGFSKSTASRHLSRAKEKLKSALKYGVYTIWTE